MLHQTKNFRELLWNLSNSWFQSITDRGSHREVFLENSCTFKNTQITLLNGTIGMELKQYIFPLRRFWTQNVLTAHQENGKVRHAK